MAMSRIKDWQRSISKIIKDDLETNKNFSMAKIKEATEYCLNSGKRLRPMLLLAFNNMPDNVVCEPSIEFALFLEYVHNASLVVDDMPCMDNDDMRRGQATLHKKYGESLSQLVSYNLLVSSQNHLRKGLEKISNNAVDNAENRKLISSIGDIVSDVLSVEGICGGQYLDLTINNSIDDMPPRKQKQEVLRIARMKTGLLFSLCFVLGWVCKKGINTSIEELTDIKEAGTSFGLAYQIVDDLKDIKTDKQRNDGLCNVCRYYKRNELIDLFSDELNNFTSKMNKYYFADIFSDLHNFLVISFKQSLTKITKK